MPVPVTLKIYKGSVFLGAKEFQRDIIKIGRLSSAHLSLEDEKISRIQTQVERLNTSAADMRSVSAETAAGQQAAAPSLAEFDNKMKSLRQQFDDLEKQLQTLPGPAAR